MHFPLAVQYSKRSSESSIKHLAYRSGRTIYQIKRGLLHHHLVQQLKAPTVHMVLA